jgi:DNA-binding MarR family transcriptional regulator
MDWKKCAWLRRGKRRLETLKTFDKTSTPLTIKDVMVKSRIAISQASATVTELEKAGLIKCLNPEDKIGKLYIISDEGKRIISALGETTIA